MTEFPLEIFEAIFEHLEPNKETFSSLSLVCKTMRLMTLQAQWSVLTISARKVKSLPSILPTLSDPLTCVQFCTINSVDCFAPDQEFSKQVARVIPLHSDLKTMLKRMRRLESLTMIPSDDGEFPNVLDVCQNLKNVTFHVYLGFSFMNIPDSVERLAFEYDNFENGYTSDYPAILDTVKNAKGLKSWTTERFVPILGDEYDGVRSKLAVIDISMNEEWNELEIDWQILQCLEQYDFPNVVAAHMFGFGAHLGSIDVAIFLALARMHSIKTISMSFCNPFLFTLGKPANLEYLQLSIEEEGWVADNGEELFQVLESIPRRDYRDCNIYDMPTLTQRIKDLTNVPDTVFDVPLNPA